MLQVNKLKNLYAMKVSDCFYRSNMILTDRMMSWLIVADILMSVILSLNWPYATVDTVYFIWPEGIRLFMLDFAYGFPVGVCLVISLFIYSLNAKGVVIGTVQRRWLVMGKLFALISGLFPLYAVNQYSRYRLAVPGFLWPYIIVILFAFWFRKPIEKNAWRPIVSWFIVLFTATSGLTLGARIILYLVKL